MRDAQELLPASHSIAKLVRQLSKLATGGQVVREAQSSCRITRGAAASVLATTEPSRGDNGQAQTGGEAEDLEAHDSFLDPAGGGMLSREPSITFGGRLPLPPTSSHARKLSRGASFRPQQLLVAETSQGYLARCVVDEGSQADFATPAEPDVSQLLATAQQVQLAELALLSSRLRQKEQELSVAAEQRARLEAAATGREREHAAALQQVQQRAAELQVQVQQLQALVSSRGAAEELEARLEQARSSIERLEAQVAVLQLDKARADARCSELQCFADSVANMVHGAPGLPGEDGNRQDSADEDGLAAIERLITQHSTLQERYLAESKLRRDLHNQLMDMKGAIRVFCRVRPMTENEEAAGVNSACLCDALNGSVEVMCGRVGGIGKDGRPSADLKQLRFTFDQVYGPNTSQEQIFRDTCSIATSVLDGYNACIFAYGQTGSGKTYTMEGTAEDRGINYRTVDELFRLAAQRRTEVQYTLTVSLVEVYMEQIRDLIGGEDRLEVRSLPSGGMHIPGLREVQVTTAGEAWGLLQAASAARHAAGTRMNTCSSRSHCLLCLCVDGKSRLTSDAWRSRLWLIDLAGSERVAKTEATGERLKEAQFINKSLSALGECIYALASKSQHIPFRNSKLTYLLQESLAGAGKTLMFVNLNPTEENAPETVCSLNFASRVRGVELGAARKNVVADPGASSEAVRELKAVVGALQEQVASLEGENRDLSNQLASSSRQVEHQQAQLSVHSRVLPGSSHHRSDTAASLGSRLSCGSAAGGSLAGRHPRWARSPSAPEPETDPGACWGLPISGAGGADWAGRSAATQCQLAKLQDAAEGYGGGSVRCSTDSHDSLGSASRFKPALPSGTRPVPRTPVPRLQLPMQPPAAKTSPGKTTPQSAGGSLVHSIEAKRSRAASPGADYASDGGSSGPDSGRQEGSRSAPVSAGRVVRSGSPASPSSAGGGIKAWKPETSAKPAPPQSAKGRWT